MAEADEIEQEEEEQEECPKCPPVGAPMDGYVCRYGDATDGFLCFDFVIC